MKQAQAGQADGHQRGGTVLREGEDGGNARFVVIFQKVRAGRDKPGRDTQQVALEFGVVAVNEVIIEAFVVSVIKSERLQPRFEVPINFAEKQKIRLRLFDHMDRVDPELAFDRGRGAGEFLPGFGEDLV